MPGPRTGVLFHVAADATDADLLGRFVRDRDEAAFAAVVRRHGRAVLGVCRRVVGHAADADDAFQATFLTLARKAHRVAFHADVSGWLFAVAVRAGREAVRRRCRRANRETAGVPDVAAGTDPHDPEVSRVVLDEVAKLSEAYRSAVVLCELDGVSRAVAARRLGIAEGTLSSRLAAARKQLAVRLTARGVTPAAVGPFAASLSAALAASTAAMAFTSEVPSSVLELMESLMRTSKPLAAGKLLAAAVLLAAVVVGGSLGDDPKPILPAAAVVPVEKKEEGRLVLTLREEVRYLTPAGKELQRIDYTQAKAAEPELLTGQITIGSGGTKVERFLPSTGQAGPGGVVPLDSHGTRLMTPGAPPTVTLVDPTDHYDRVAGWSANGRQFVGVTWDVSMFWGFTGYAAYRVDALTGAREKLPLPANHVVLDASADGRWFLTHRYQPRPLGLPGFATQSVVECVLDTAGQVRWEFGSSTRVAIAPHRLSPDGRRIVGTAEEKGKAGTRPRLAVSDLSRPNEIRTSVYDGPPGDAEYLGAAWSPDGKRIVSVWRTASGKDKQTWHVRVCDADGENLRTVATTEAKAGEVLKSVDWW